MKFEASMFKTKGDEPDFFARFAAHYAFVTKFLLDFNANRFSFTADIKSETKQTTLAHNRETPIGHSLGFVPERVLFIGRVEMYQLVASSGQAVTVQPKLLTTGLVNPPYGKLTDVLIVADTALFRVGDPVVIGTAYRTITGILGNRVTLDRSFVCETVYVMSLATEQVKAIIF